VIYDIQCYGLLGDWCDWDKCDSLAGLECAHWIPDDGSTDPYIEKRCIYPSYCEKEYVDPIYDEKF